MLNIFRSNHFKKISMVILCMLTAICFIFSADESRVPLTLKADALTREAGTLDGTCAYINAESGYSGTFLRTKNFMLNKGSYRIGVEYRTDTEGNTLSRFDNGQTTCFAVLSPGTTYEEYPFTLTKDSQDISFLIDYNGTGSLAIDSITLIPESRFYTDAYFYAILVLLLGIAVLLVLHCPRIRLLCVQSKAIALALLGIAFIASLPCLNGYLNWGDDICYHLIRIEGIKDGLASGQFPVVIYPEGMRGNGYLNCMYPNLFLYIPALLRLGNVSIAASYKFLVVLFQLLTVVITYFSVKSICNMRKAALLAALLYTLCPYRLTNFYARGALGEALAMTFFPLLLAGLYHVVLGNQKKYWMLVLGFSGLVQTHVLSSLLGTILCVLLGILCITNIFTEKRWLTILKAASLTLLLNAWFLVPFLYFYTMGNLRTDALDWSNFSEYSLNFSGLLGTLNTGDYRTLSLGLPIALCAAIGIFYFLLEAKTEHKQDAMTQRLFAGFLLVIGGICTFMIINQFPGWEFMNIELYSKFFSNIQFAWRMLSPASVTLAIAGCILLYRSKLLAPYRQGIIIALTAVCLLSATRYQPEDFAYASYESTYSRGHLSKINGIPKGKNTIVYPYEWCPDGFAVVEPPTAPDFSNPDAVADVIWTRTGTTTTLSYQNTAAGNTVRLPLIAYTGYRAFDENGAVLPLIENKEQQIEVALADPDGSFHEIVVEYKGMASFTAAFIVSLSTVLLCAAFPFLKKRGLLPYMRKSDKSSE